MRQGRLRPPDPRVRTAGDPAELRGSQRACPHLEPVEPGQPEFCCARSSRCRMTNGATSRGNFTTSWARCCSAFAPTPSPPAGRRAAVTRRASTPRSGNPAFGRGVAAGQPPDPGSAAAAPHPGIGPGEEIQTLLRNAQSQAPQLKLTPISIRGWRCRRPAFAYHLSRDSGGRDQRASHAKAGAVKSGR